MVAADELRITGEGPPSSDLGGAAPVELSVRGLSKTFPGTRALRGVDLDVRAGEIHALVGGNGSGKSTLIKILTGIHRGDPGGEVRVGDRAVAATDTSPEFARAAGVSVVHQDLGIFPDLSVAENLTLGFGYETGIGGRVRWRDVRARAERLLDRFEIDARPDTPLRSLSPVVRTQVAIARALQGTDDDRRGVLILDEPTASLSGHEVDLLLETLRRDAASGQAILYVSHRLDEVLSLADRVTVLRDGCRTGTYEATGLDEQRLIELIVGRKIDQAFPARERQRTGEPTLAVSGLRAGPLRNVGFVLEQGEVLGLAGLVGSGRTEVLRVLFGDLRPEAGTIQLAGAPYVPQCVRDAIQAGVAYIPEDRSAEGVFPDLSITENLAMATVPGYWSRARIDDRRMRRDADELIQRFLVRTSNRSAAISTLSGGNQQKVVLARWLHQAPQLILLDEPTQGVDVGARTEIYNLVHGAAAAGAGVIVVASDAEELAHVCDRIVVLRDGRIAEQLQGDGMTAHAVTQSIYGSKVV